MQGGCTIYENEYMLNCRQDTLVEKPNSLENKANLREQQLLSVTLCGQPILLSKWQLCKYNS